ncbi:hypothetical protein LCGC14_0901760 [marine sediment metagenome]|uniref:dATP/dGTP diphosphohydrolase N-terminal domain-containing protein n=1 Tax=marine sediment metagenome TaxID=412755 RepID=A0A0F9PGW2_9ZZZZ
MHDSGERQEFASGAVRDTASGKPRMDLISPIFMEHLGAWLGLGARPKSEGGKGYGEHNWEKGIPVSRFMASLCRHVNAIAMGDTSENHEMGVAFNIMGITHTREMVRRGRLPAILDNLPDYRPKTFLLKPRVSREKVADTVFDEDMPLRVYVAGPFSADSGGSRFSNRCRAENAGRDIMLRGHDAHVPHAATAHLHGEYPYERFMRLDFGIIERWANALYYIGPSPGADRELELAEKLGLLIFKSLAEVPDLRGFGECP